MLTRLPSLLPSRSSSSPKVIPTNPNVVPLAGRQGKPNARAAQEIVRCSPPFAPNAAKKQKYLLNHVKAGRYIAANVSIKTELTDANF